MLPTSSGAPLTLKLLHRASSSLKDGVGVGADPPPPAAAAAAGAAAAEAMGPPGTAASPAARRSSRPIKKLERRYASSRSTPRS